MVIMMRNYFLPGLLLLCSLALNAQSGYELKVEMKNYPHDSLFLGFYYGDKQYLKDTAVIEKGKFVFKQDEPLKPGTYLLILRPDNAFVQININKQNQKLDIRFDAQDAVNTIEVKGDKDNTAFYKYVRYLNELRPRADELRKKLENPDLPAEEKKKLEDQLNILNAEVLQFQKKMVAENKGTMTAMMIDAFMERTIPEFSDLDTKDRQIAQYRYFMDHYFDGIDFSEEGVIRTSYFFQKVQDYVIKHTVQIPDSINKAVDHVMEKMKGNEDAYKYFLVHFVNHFAKSNIIGMDAVYVHIVDKYYANGEAPWVDEEQLGKMLKNADALRPILIGCIAPDIKMERQDGSKVSLHDIKSPYTVLIFWAPDCGHCQKTMPKVIDFYNNYKNQGVEIFSVCTKLTDKVPDCWKMVEEKGMGIFLNVVDPYHQSKFSTLYDVRSTPQIFILDDKKEILLKRIATEQLEEVMGELLERRKNIQDELK